MLAGWQKYRHSFWSAFLLMIRTIAGFGSQKIVAIFFGPIGTTMFSHFQNLVALFTQPIQDAVGNGLISAIPKKSFQKAQLVGSALIVIILLASLSGVLLLISNQFRQSVFDFSIQNWLLIVPSILVFCLGIIVSSIYIVQQKLKLYSFIVFIQWSVFFVIVAAVEFELKEILIFWLIIQSLFVLVLIYPIYPQLKFNFTIDREVKYHFKQFLLMAVTIWLSSKWVNYFIREFAIDEFGAIQTGLWQSVVKISEAYRGLLISFLFLTFYPMITKMIATHNWRFSSIRKYCLPYILLSVTFLGLVFHFDEYVLATLYSEEYREAENLFSFQIIGDIFAFLSLPFSIYLIASIQTKTYIFTELMSSVVFVALVVAKSSLGIEILVFAHIFRFIVFLLMVGFVGIKDLRNES